MWPGTLIAVTGGTSGVSRRVEYSYLQWRESVAVTSQALAENGVGSKTKAVVAFPGSPWAIGPVFAEAALNCGATVLPAGQWATNSAFFQILQEFQPNCFMGSSNMLSSLSIRSELDTRLNWIKSIQICFSAGELLLPGTRETLKNSYGVQVVDIYGMAEFDTVAAEMPETLGLVLAPCFHYSLFVNDEYQPLAHCAKGRLAIRRNSEQEWHLTPDLVEVLPIVNRRQQWFGSYCIQVLDRCDESCSLFDGTKLSGEHVNRLVSFFPNLTHAQILISATSSCHVAEMMWAGQSDGPSPLEIESALGLISVDLADSIRHGFLRVTSSTRTSPEMLKRTARGKIPRIFTTSNESTITTL